MPAFDPETALTVDITKFVASTLLTKGAALAAGELIGVKTTSRVVGVNPDIP